jgi:hypothetical protein
VLPREQQGRSLAGEIGFERGGITLQLGLELGVGPFVEQLQRGVEIVGAGQQIAPGLELGAETVGFAKDLLGAPLVVPEPGFLGQRLELGDALGLGLEVKDAPRSTGSVRPGRGPRRSPLVPNLEILEQKRSQLDEPQGRLAPRDDGVDAGAVAVVRAYPAVAVAVQGRSVAAGPAITLARDQIDECGVLGLLHGPSLSGDTLGTSGVGWERPARGSGGPGATGFGTVYEANPPAPRGYFPAAHPPGRLGRA